MTDLKALAETLTPDELNELKRMVAQREAASREKVIQDACDRIQPFLDTLQEGFTMEVTAKWNFIATMKIDSDEGAKLGVVDVKVCLDGAALSLSEAARQLSQQNPKVQAALRGINEVLNGLPYLDQHAVASTLGVLVV